MLSRSPFRFQLLSVCFLFVFLCVFFVRSWSFSCRCMHCLLHHLLFYQMFCFSEVLVRLESPFKQWLKQTEFGLTSVKQSVRKERSPCHNDWWNLSHQVEKVFWRFSSIVYILRKVLFHVAVSLSTFFFHRYNFRLKKDNRFHIIENIFRYTYFLKLCFVMLWQELIKSDQDFRPQWLACSNLYIYIF